MQTGKQAEDPMQDAPAAEDLPWNEYPRPHLRRDSWVNLNGLWQFDLSLPKSVLEPGGSEDDYGVQVRVPYPPESDLSGIGLPLDDNDIRFYRRPFRLPEDFSGDRYLLHFGAADQSADVYLNGHRLGHHDGGYEHFTFDITEFLEDQNELIVRVEDRLNDGVLPYGKQKHKRGGMWYQPVSGLWQTVWIEAVPEHYIGDIEISTRGSDVTVKVLPPRETAPAHSGIIRMPAAAETGSGTTLNGTVTLNETGETFPIKDGTAHFSVKDPEFWTPETPKLYNITVKCGEDAFDSYFALRDLSVKTAGGVPRLCLNGKPYYFHGVLDQGYFDDGIFLPKDPDRYEKDILMLKRMGFNMLRKHIKVEPEIFYFACDRLGMAVFQDMVENGHYSFFRDTVQPTLGIGLARSDAKLNPDEKAQKAFRSAMESTVKQLKCHPCIVEWTIFNEGWGQFKGNENYRFLKSLDDSRFIDTASGWFEQTESDVISRHVYFRDLKCVMKDIEKQRAAASSQTGSEMKPVIISEYGGYACAVQDHLFDEKKHYGYRTMKSTEAFEDALVKLFDSQLLPLVRAGLSADVLTQLSDVEEEINGLVTFDRAVEKADAERLKKAADAMCEISTALPQDAAQ